MDINTKHFLTSKINWFAFLTLLGGLLTYFGQLDLDPKTLGLIATAVGFINFILRTYFSGTTLTTSSQPTFNG